MVYCKENQDHDWGIIYLQCNISLFDNAKHLVEEEVRQYARTGHDAVILNPSAVIGAGDKNLVSSAIVRYMARGWIPPIPPGRLNVIHIDDVITGHIAAIESGVSGERYILGGRISPSVFYCA